MANGDILSATITLRDYTPTLEITVEGLSTGGTYDLGYTVNGDPTGSNVEVTLTSEAYDATGTGTTSSRTIYVTKPKRQAYPNDSDNDESVSGSDVIIRLALSEWVYANDSSVTVDLGAGLYTQGGTPSAAASDQAVTNSSTQGYGAVISNWSAWYHGRRIGYDEYTNTEDDSGTFELRAVAYHRHGVACVKFSATGQTSSHTATATVALPTIDSVNKYGDQNPVPEYIGSISSAGFTQGELVDCKYIAYPLIGDNPFDCSASGYTHPTCKAFTHTMLCDKSHTYGGAVAVVSTTGNDGTGAVVAESAFDSESPPDAFLTLGGACNAIRTYNNSNYSRADHGASIVYMQAGSYTGYEVGVTGAASACYLVIAPFPGVAAASVIFDGESGDTHATTTYELRRNITINQTTGYTTRYAIYSLFYKVDFVNTLNYNGTDGGISAHMGCTYADFDQGFRGISTRDLGHHIRGASWSVGGSENCYADVVLGSTFDGVIGVGDEFTGMGNSRIIGGVFAYNKFLFDSDANIFYFSHEANANTIGQAIINNICEQSLNPSGTSQAICWIAGSGSEIEAANNFIIWNNVFVGQRNNMAYNDYNLNGVGAAPRLLWSVKNNIFENFNCITDNDPHGGTADGARTGNHSLVHGTSVEGNIYRDQIGVSGAHPDAGIKNQDGEGSPIDVLFTDDASGAGDESGNGDYSLQEGSPAIDATFQRLILFDFDGNARGATDEIGAFRYAVAAAGGGNSHSKRLRNSLMAARALLRRRQ